MEEFVVVVKGNFERNAIDVRYTPGVHIRWEPSAEKFIGDAWEEYVRSARKAGIEVYNGNVLRLDNVRSESGRLSLELSDIDFRSCIGSETTRFTAAFPHEPQGNPLTVCVALVTTDRKIVLEERSRIDARRRKYHVIAGFMEREFDTSDNRPDPFDALRREVREELGLILDNALCATGLVRAVYGSELCFCSRLPISFDDLLHIKAKSETDREIDALRAVEDSPSAVASFLSSHTSDFVPSGRACLLLYGRQAYGEDWYEVIMNSR
ncbi:MAG TPA: NUDIX hydrolase [Syntrophorhabdales bacterium]|nr:NUDIX hydrolase [Syntrophorhabdales bacterium]